MPSPPYIHITHLLLFTSYGCLLELIKLSLDETQHQAGLAHGHVAQQHQLELADLGLWKCAVGAASTPSGAHGGPRRRRQGGWGLLPGVEHSCTAFQTECGRASAVVSS